MKQSLLEQGYSNKGKSHATATEDQDDEDLQKALEFSMRGHEHHARYQYGEASEIWSILLCFERIMSKYPGSGINKSFELSLHATLFKPLKITPNSYSNLPCSAIATARFNQHISDIASHLLVDVWGYAPKRRHVHGNLLVPNPCLSLDDFYIIIFDGRLI